MDGVGIVRGSNEDGMGVQEQLNYRTAGEGSFEHPPPSTWNNIQVSASQSSLAPFFADSENLPSILQVDFFFFFPYQRSQKTVQLNSFTTGLAFCQLPTDGASIADLFAMWRGGDGKFLLRVPLRTG